MQALLRRIQNLDNHNVVVDTFRHSWSPGARVGRDAAPGSVAGGPFSRERRHEREGIGIAGG